MIKYKHLKEVSDHIKNHPHSLNVTQKDGIPCLNCIHCSTNTYLHPDDSYDLHINRYNLSRASYRDAVNNHTPDITFSKKGTDIFYLEEYGITFNGEVKLHFSAEGNLLDHNGVTDELAAVRNVYFRKHNRALRKNLQPRLRLLGKDKFQKPERGRFDTANECIQAILDGDLSFKTINSFIYWFSPDDYIHGVGYQKTWAHYYDPSMLTNKVMQTINKYRNTLLLPHEKIAA